MSRTARNRVNESNMNVRTVAVAVLALELFEGLDCVRYHEACVPTG
jgi:hypothetical protein